MNQTFKYTIFFLALCCLAQLVAAQAPVNDDWDSPKIKGVRLLPYPSYNGTAFLTENWCPGKVELSTGEIIGGINIKYCSYKDELFYYNREATSQINIDRASLNGFEFTDTDGIKRIFRKQYFETYQKTYRFFEVLYSGPVSILAFRKTSLNNTSPYRDRNGILKNLEYVPEHQFYFYSPEKGYAGVKINRVSFLSKFEKANQRPVKKLLRKSKIKIMTENTLIDAWKTASEEGYNIVF